MMFVRLIFVLVVSALCVKSEYTDPHCSGKQVIVHLFEWKWTDIADECERFLSKKGYCGVQVSPANEYAVIDKRPWWERYQPVSYKINTRSGNEAQFKDMVTRCKNVGVRIYVDAVVNHMAGLGRIGTGTGGSHFDSDNFDFPGVPYRREHFNPRSKCPSGSGNVDNYGDPNNVRNCFLVGLTDLNQNLEYVRDKIADYFNRLIAIGVAGFRVDASKHMWPADLKAIEERTNDLPEGGKPFFVHEVIDQNDGAVKVTEYEPYGYVTEMRYCQKIAWGINNFGQLNNVVDYGWGMTDSAHAFIFVDNHDNQRGHGGGGNLITHKQPRSYKLAQAFTLAYNYGFPRVMSSYFFQSTDQGPPHNDDYSIKDVTIEGDGSCGNGWVCEHRWPAIANMVWFRNAVAGTDLNHWRNENDEVSFSRGNKGFFAMAKQGHMDATLQTGLPAGQYCDLITDCKTKVTVDGSGNAHIVINDNETPILAFIVGGPSGPSNTHGSSGGTSAPVVTSGPAVTSGPVVTSAPVTSEPAPSGWARTIIMVQARTSTGQDVFIRGGIDHGHRNGCTNQASSSACAIPIKSHNLGTGSHYAGYNAWRQGDNFLDWYGPEPGQGSYHGASAKGTPAVWTTNQPGGHGYTPLNTYGEHYWLVDVDMDCSKTENGWFEIKALINNNWEHDMRVSGCGTESAPYASNNHWVKCGSKNVLHFNSGSCEISPISS